MPDEPTVDDDKEHIFLYLTTTGHKSGKPHQIEIWYVEYDGRCYIVAEFGDKAHWVRNLRRSPAVTFRVGRSDDGGQEQPGLGRVVDREAEPALAAAVSALMDAKYGWSDGLIVELAPSA